MDVVHGNVKTILQCFIFLFHEKQTSSHTISHCSYFPDGIKLNQGYVADEDTTIYNPGLTLLTGSEKERLVSTIIENREIGLSTTHWSDNNEYAFDFLKQKLDPLHMYELEGYLSILPFYGAAVYLVGLWAQQNVRGVFPLVYGACAMAVFAPIIVLVSSGP